MEKLQEEFIMKRFLVTYKISCNGCDSYNTVVFSANSIQEAEIIAENDAADMTDEDYYYNVSSIEEF